MVLLPEISHRHDPIAFQDRPVAKEILERLLEAGCLSPSVKNRQPWRFIAITDFHKKLALQQACYGDERCQKGEIIAACYATTDYQMVNGLSANLFDLGMACAQIMLQAEKEGLSAEALTSFSQTEASRLLTLPYGMYIVALVLIGYPEAAEKLDMRRKYLPFQRKVNYNSW